MLKKIKILYLLILFSFASINAEDDFQLKKIKEQLPKLLGANNVGTEFIFGFHPCWEETGQNNAIRIYVSSPVETEVRITIPYFSDDPFEIKKTKPNDIIEFILAPSVAQPYSRGVGGLTSTLLPTQIFKGRGIILEADAPVVVYGVTRFQYTSDGFLALPTHALGKEYVISSYRETADFKNQSLTPYADIIGVYPRTKVSFYFGGNNNSRIRTLDDRIWKPFEVLRAELNRGDFWLIASEGASSDLGGSYVIASQPVSVLSGNHCAYVPSQLAACDFIIEQELPTNTWGTKYYVSPIVDRAKSSIIRVFAKEGPTTVLRDGVEQFTLFTNWGLQQEAWTELRANPDTNKGAVYHSDKQIYVVQYNTGQQDDNVQSDPFQLVITAQEQFQKDIIFNTPGIKDGFGFQRNYINLIYESDFNEQIPDDLELGEILITGGISWKKIKDISSAPGNPFDDPDLRGTSKKMFSKTIRLPYDAVYRIRSKYQNIAAYAYGFASYDSYGFPTSMAIIDLEKADSLTPVPYFELTCDGNTIDKKTYVIDMPENDTIRSNMSVVLFDKNNSFNYEFKCDKFIPGETRTLKWSLKVIDPSLDAKAIITFSDKKGNDTTLIVEYFAVKLSITPKNYYFGNVKIGEQKSQQFSIKNESETSSAYITELILKTLKEKLNSQGFELFYSFDINQPILPKDSRNFLITFQATTGGEFKDSIGVGDTCFFKYRTLIRANVGVPIINVSDIDFGKVTVGSSPPPRIATISNTGTTSITISSFKDMNLRNFSHNLPLVNDENPIIIEKGGQFQFEVLFKPDSVKDYNDSIVFLSDAGRDFDPVCFLSGIGVEPQLEATSDDWGRKRVHLSKYDSYPYFNFSPYPSPSGSLVLTNNGTKEVTLNNISIIESKNGEAFEIDVSGTLVPLLNFVNNLSFIKDEKGNSINVIDAGSSSHIPIYFHPKVEGEHVLKIEYISDSPKRASSTFSGIGIFPKLVTQNINFGSRIIGEPPTRKKLQIKNQNWDFQDSVTIQSLNEFPLLAINDTLGKPGKEGFSYDLANIRTTLTDSLRFPITLQPSEYIEFETEYEAQKVGNASAELITLSDAKDEAISQFAGFGILEKLILVAPTEEYYCFDPEKDLIAVIINNGTIDVTFPPNPFRLIGLNSSSFTLHRVLRKDNSMIDFTNSFKIFPNDTIRVVVRYTPSEKPQSNNEEYHECLLQVETNAVIEEGKLLYIPIKLRTISYSRKSETRINGELEVTIDPARDLKVDPIKYSVYILEGKDLEIAYPLEFKVTVEYEKSFLGINKFDNTHKIYPGKGLPNDWKIDSYTLNYEVGSNKEVLTVNLKGSTPFISSKKQEILQIEFLVFLPVNKEGENKDNSRNIRINHKIESELYCIDFIEPMHTEVHLKSFCVDDFRSITVKTHDYFLSNINPNPVKSSGTELIFSIPFTDFVEISLNNAAGMVVEKIISQKLKAGKYSVQIETKDLSNGIYFIEMKSGEYTEFKKFSLEK